ncbi:MAG: hypothetical protein EBV03_07610 [Proteobacteria bacterium]|nr:hypothetical protein [Pseudomonadota bacterium]
MSNNWLYNIRHVTPGEPVQANIVNRPDYALEDRTNYLKDRLDAAALGQALFDVDATIAEDVLEGQPVFWNYQTQRYERALAAVENDEITQTLTVQASSDCLGLLYKKKSATLGDIVMRGIVKLPGISNAVTGAVTAGRYYLSSEAPGKLTKQRPPATVSVCYVQGPKDNCAAEPWVVVMPQVRDFLEDHIHYRFELVSQPAGTASTANGVVTITSPNVNTQGWLPASHASFNDKAPTGAVFGYNLKAHDAIARVWPPMPVSAVAVLWDKGANRVGATEVPMGADGLVVCDTNGIWWMSNCAGDVPWPVAASSSSSASPTPECPRNERMRVVVVFLRMVFGNDRNVVTSLEAAPGSPITITNCDGLAAKTGDLEIDLNLNLAIKAPVVDGGKVLKTIEGGQLFREGWVTEGIVSGSPSIVLTSVNTPSATYTRTLTTSEKTALGLNPADTVTAKQGLVKISFNDALVERDISPQIIRLSDVVERLYNDIPYLGFPQGQDSAVRVRLNVPAAGLGTGLTMKIRAQLFGRKTATLPALEVTYRKLPRPGTGGASLVIADVSPALTFNSAVAVTQDVAIEVESAAFSVNEGDTVLVTLRRPLISGGADAYTAEIGLLRLAGIVTSSS